MSWVDRFFRPFRRRAPRRPWVSPRFLAVALGLGLLAGGFLLHGAGPGPKDPAAGATKREYVGAPSLDAILQSKMYPPCDADCLYGLWLAEHSNVVVVRRTPVAEAGYVIGYWVEYREATP